MREPAPSLTERVDAASAEKARLDDEVARARSALEELRAKRDAHRRSRILRLAKRRSLIGAALVALLALAVVGWTWSRRVASESLTGSVVSVAGPAPAVAGDACTVRVEPAWFPFNTWMQVDCGRRRLYGYESFGHLQCDTASARVLSCEDRGPIDQDGDPHLLLDRPAGRLALDDAGRWRIEIALDRTR